jgi:hypothetical protein
LPGIESHAVEWHPEKEKESDLQTNTLYFVSRETAIAQLLIIHEQAFDQVEAGGVLKPCIPICSNIHGLGKSTLAMYYVQKCRERWKDIGVKSRFQTTLCQSRTLYIHMSTARFSSRFMYDSEMIRLLKVSMSNLFKTPPACLEKNYHSSQEFLKALTREAGPVFIVLDGTAEPFHNDYHPERSYLECHNAFVLFCTQVVGTWSSIKEVFFLLNCRTYILSSCPEVEQRTAHASDTVEFRRLSLEMIPTDGIAEILKNTWFSSSPGEKRLSEHYGLDDSQIQLVSQLLYAQTNGHPRSMLKFLRGCNSFQDFLELEPQKIIHYWKPYKEVVIRNKMVVKYLVQAIQEKRKVDLSEIWDPADTIRSKSVPLDVIATSVGFVWDGCVNDATLHIHSSLLEILDNYSNSLQDYLKRINTCNDISLDCPNAFEWMFISRLQEIFSTKHSPRSVLPAFFDTPLFGRCDGLVFEKFVQLLPKITSRVRKSDSVHGFSDNTLSPLSFFFLRGDIDIPETIALKALPNSASPDAIFAANVNLPCRGPVRLTLGVALKCYKQGTDCEQEFSREQLDDECTKFSHMFTCESAWPSESRLSRLNVLLVCATQYTSSLSDLFKGERFLVINVTKKFKYVDEAILLDLSSREKRAAFFNLSPDNILVSAIEKVIDTSYKARV